MDLSNNNNYTITTTSTETNNTKTPQAELETLNTQIQKPKQFSHSNGVLKRKKPTQLNPNHVPVVVYYRECLKNHAASIGGHAVDGCGEFMANPEVNPVDPTSLTCAACGCHRNFHRREMDEPVAVVPALEYHSHHRYHPPPPLPLPPPPGGDRSGSPSNSPSPPPISSAYYPASAPHMLLALSAGFSGEKNPNTSSAPAGNSDGRKRFRTRFTSDQKVKMLEFAERVGWKMQKRDEDVVSKFCSEIGVEKGVFKVWMHNNKNTSGGRKPEQHDGYDDDNNNNNSNHNNNDDNGNSSNVNGFCIVSRNNSTASISTGYNYENKKVDTNFGATNGSSSSS